MYVAYIFRLNSWCIVTNDLGAPTITVVKSGFTTESQAKKYLTDTKE